MLRRNVKQRYRNNSPPMQSDVALYARNTGWPFDQEAAVGATPTWVAQYASCMLESFIGECPAKTRLIAGLFRGELQMRVQSDCRRPLVLASIKAIASTITGPHHVDRFLRVHVLQHFSCRRG
jgi:hypothetical protein